jgi:hypothetical protein
MPRISVKLLFIPGILLLSISSFILLKSCEKDKYQHPVVHTGEVTDITPEGAMFHGRITEMGSEEIVDHGFVWGTAKEPNLDNSIKILLGKAENTEFQKYLDNSLQKGRTYYMRSFVTDNNGTTYYGRIVSFNSLGSLAPEILSIYPMSGVWRDTITIKGKRLGESAEFVKVMIDNIESQIILHSQDSLKFIVPDELLIAEAHVNVIVAGNSAEFEDKFYIKEPEIHSLSQDYISRGDTIVLNGLGFHPNISHNKLLVGDKELQVFQASSNELAIIHTDYMDHGEYTLRLKVANQWTEYENTFTIYEPWIQLNNLPWPNAPIPTGVSLNNRGYVTILTSEQRLYEYNPGNDSWIPKNYLPFINPENAFVTDNHIYLISFFSGVYQYNQDTDQWIEKENLPPTNYPYGYSTFSIGTSGYVCGGYDGGGYWSSTNRLLKYNEETNLWTQKSDFPLPGIFEGIGFSINEKGYVGLGRSARYTPILELYEYDPDTNQWTLKISFEDIMYESNFGRSLSNVFVINEKAYIFSGSRVLGTYYWTRNKDIYEFDPIANTIRRLPDNPSPERIYSFSFAVNGKGYIGGGSGPGFTHNDFWEFDPEKLPPANE